MMLRRHLIGGALVGGREIEHVPALIFVDAARGLNGEFFRILAAPVGAASGVVGLNVLAHPRLLDTYWTRATAVL
jgi:hypothetical protein